MLLQFGSLRSVLLSSPTELSAIPGVPPLAALSVPQYVPLLYGGEDASSPSSLNGIRVDSPDKAAKIFRKILGYGKTEKFYALHLDKHMRILAVERVADGGSSRVAVSISRLVSSAILSGAKYVILSHNHPNNADFASAADVSVTKSISDACYIVGIKLLDHIIMAGLAPDAYCSLTCSRRLLQPCTLRLPPRRLLRYRRRLQIHHPPRLLAAPIPLPTPHSIPTTISSFSSGNGQSLRSCPARKRREICLNTRLYNFLSAINRSL